MSCDVDVGQPLLELGDVSRRPHAGHDVLSLCVGQEVAARVRSAGDLVAREGDARPRRLALVPEDHLLHVDGRAPLVRDALDAAVLDRPLAHPRVEYGTDRLDQLLARVGRELVQRLEALGQLPQRGGFEVGVQRHATLALRAGDLVLEPFGRDAAHDVSEHLHEAAVGVPCEALVTGAPGQALHGAVVQPQVENGVEHSRHRIARAAAHRQQQRVVVVPQLLARQLLEPAPGHRRPPRRARRAMCGHGACTRRMPRSRS